MCQLSCCPSSIMHSSCHQWGSSLGASTYSPSTPVPQCPVPLSQWTPVESCQRDLQGLLLRPAQLVGLGDIFGCSSPSPFASWQLHCGAGAPVRRAPIPGGRWCSSPGALSLAHQDITDPGGPGQSPFSSGPFFEHHVLLFCLKLWSCCIEVQLIPLFCKITRCVWWLS